MDIFFNIFRYIFNGIIILCLLALFNDTFTKNPTNATEHIVERIVNNLVYLPTRVFGMLLKSAVAIIFGLIQALVRLIIKDFTLEVPSFD